MTGFLFKGGCGITLPISVAMQTSLPYSARAQVVLVSIFTSCHPIQKVAQFLSLVAQSVMYFATGLFHRAIIQSGTSTCPWALNPKIAEYTRMLANHLNCPSDASRELLACLRTRKAEEIAGIRKHLTIGLVNIPLIFPIVLCISYKNCVFFNRVLECSLWLLYLGLTPKGVCLSFQPIPRNSLPRESLIKYL